MAHSNSQRKVILLIIVALVGVLALLATPVVAVDDSSQPDNSFLQVDDDNVDSQDVNDADLTFATFDALSGQVVWQGQVVSVGGFEANSNVQFRERIDDSTTRLQAELVSDENGVVTFNTKHYAEGDYFLSGGGVTVDGTDLSNTFGIVQQSLSTEFKKDIVTDAGPISITEFEIDSNRGAYPITIHAHDELTTDELINIFVNQGPFGLYYTAEGDDGETEFDEIGLKPVHDSDEYRIDFEGIDAGEYEFIFKGTDTTAISSDTLSVRLDENYNVEPTADFSYSPTLPDPGQTVSFDASASSDDDGEIVSYQWDFNGDGATDATGKTVSHTYHSEGIYDVSLTVVDDDGATSFIFHSISVATNEDRIQNPEAIQKFITPPHTNKQSYDELTNDLLWQGQIVAVDGFEPHSNIQLRERIDGSTTRLRAELSSNADGTVMFTTKDHTEGDYFIRGYGTNVDGTDLSNTFEITEQLLTASFAEQTVSQTGANSQTHLEFDSNRGTYPINVTTVDGDLHAVQLADLFGSATINGKEAFEVINMEVQRNDTITITAGGTTGITDSDEYLLDFADADINPGEYEFVFSGADTTASDTDTITVGESDGPSEEHESGVDQEVFDAIDRSGDGDPSLGDIQAAVDDWSSNQQINGVEANLGDLQAIVDWWA